MGDTGLQPNFRIVELVLVQDTMISNEITDLAWCLAQGISQKKSVVFPKHRHHLHQTLAQTQTH